MVFDVEHGFFRGISMGVPPVRIHFRSDFPSNKPSSDKGVPPVPHYGNLHDWIRMLVGGLEHEFYCSMYWECHHPN